MDRRRAGMILLILGAVLVLAAVVRLGLHAREAEQAGQAAQEALAEPCSYNEMKNWFLKKFTEIADFHKMREELLKTA